MFHALSKITRQKKKKKMRWNPCAIIVMVFPKDPRIGHISFINLATIYYYPCCDYYKYIYLMVITNDLFY